MQLVSFQTKRFGKMIPTFVICLKGCNCCTFMDILALSELRNSIFFSQVGPVCVLDRTSFISPFN